MNAKSPLLYGIRIVGFHARKGPIIGELFLYGIRDTIATKLGKVLDIEMDHTEQEVPRSPDN